MATENAKKAKKPKQKKELQTLSVDSGAMPKKKKPKRVEDGSRVKDGETHDAIGENLEAKEPKKKKAKKQADSAVAASEPVEQLVTRSAEALDGSAPKPKKKSKKKQAQISDGAVEAAKPEVVSSQGVPAAEGSLQALTARPQEALEAASKQAAEDALPSPKKRKKSKSKAQAESATSEEPAVQKSLPEIAHMNGNIKAGPDEDPSAPKTKKKQKKSKKSVSAASEPPSQPASKPTVTAETPKQPPEPVSGAEPAVSNPAAKKRKKKLKAAQEAGNSGSEGPAAPAGGTPSTELSAGQLGSGQEQALVEKPKKKRKKSQTTEAAGEPEGLSKKKKRKLESGDADISSAALTQDSTVPVQPVVVQIASEKDIETAAADGEAAGKIENALADQTGEEAVIGPAETRRGTAAKAFQRVKAEEWLNSKAARDNSYEATFGNAGWGAKAQEVLGQVRGKDFRHEKTKKKRGSYRGGVIDNTINSFKFESDEE